MKSRGPQIYGGRLPGRPSSPFRENVVYSLPMGMSPALPSPTAAPGIPGDLTIYTDAPNWCLSWSAPADASQTALYSQVRYATGSVELSDTNFVASGTLWGDWAVEADPEYGLGWMLHTENTSPIVLTTTAAPDPSGDLQFGVRYMNSNGNTGSVATASSTF